MTTKIKIGIVGSRAYTNKNKIKELIFEIKEKYGNSVEIVSGGQKDGADGFVKKFQRCASETHCQINEIEAIRLARIKIEIPRLSRTISHSACQKRPRCHCAVLQK